MASERGVYGPPDGRTIGTGAKVGFAIGFGLILVGLGGSVLMDLNDRREQTTEADRRRARIAARAYVVRQGIR